MTVTSSGLWIPDEEDKAAERTRLQLVPRQLPLNQAPDERDLQREERERRVRKARRKAARHARRVNRGRR